MRFFGLSSCDTCRKALRELRAAGLNPEVIDVRRDGLSQVDRASVIAAFGDKAINRASTTWRGLDMSEKARDPASLLVEHPALMKRPVIEVNGELYQGWSAATRSAVLPDGAD